MAESIEAEFAAVWPDLSDLPVNMVNQMIVQAGIPTPDGLHEGFHVAFGRVDPPLVFGPPDVVRAQTEAYDGKLPIVPTCRMFLTKERAREFALLLLSSVQNLDEADRAAEAARRG